MAERRTPPEPVALLLAGVGLPADAQDRAPEPGPASLFGAPPPGVRAGAEAVRTAVSSPSAPPVARAAPAISDLDARLEALLVVADGPRSLAALATAVDRPIAVVRQAVDRIRDDYDGRAAGRRRGFELREIATGWRLYARAEHDGTVAAFLQEDAPARLSQAALETLAVVAYRQPVTRGQVAAIRAVSVDSVMRTLVARGLIAETGTSEETGAVLYGTTDALLTALGIGSLADLPPIAPLLAGADRLDGEIVEHVR